MRVPTMISRHVNLKCAVAVLFLLVSSAKSEILLGAGSQEARLLSDVYSICVDVPDRIEVVIYQHVDSEVVNFFDKDGVFLQVVIDPYPSRKFSSKAKDHKSEVIENHGVGLSLLAATYSKHFEGYYSFVPLVRSEARGDRVFLRIAYSIEECSECGKLLEKILNSMRYCSGVNGKIIIGSSQNILPPFRSATPNPKHELNREDRNRH